eukprot:11335270-Heterocapsa_arctica.AAC.1
MSVSDALCHAPDSWTSIDPNKSHERADLETDCTLAYNKACNCLGTLLMPAGHAELRHEMRSCES